MTKRKTRGKRSKVDLLPSAIKTKLDLLLRDNKMTQIEILAIVNALIDEAGLTDDKKLSPAGVNRYASKMETVGQEIRNMRESTEMWVAQFGSKPTGETTQLLLEMLKTQHFNLLREATIDPDKCLDAKTINSLALALNRLENAAMLNLKREKEIRKAFADEAAAKISETAKNIGVSAEGAEAFKNVLLELAL
jgi:hypothetical protein